MQQLHRILVGHDFSTGGEIALQSAAAFATRYGAVLRVVHIIEQPHLYQRLSHPLTAPYTPEELAQRAGTALEAIVARSSLEHLQVEYEVHTGKPFVELIIARRAWNADLIVVGGNAQGEEHGLGRTSERVVRKAMVPVLIAKVPFPAEAKTLLVPTDFSTGARKAAEEALTLAASFGARVLFLHAIDVPHVYAVTTGADMPALPPSPVVMAEELEVEWQAFLSDMPLLQTVPWERRTVTGVTARAIVQQAGDKQADIIVMGTHGRTGLAHMLLGGVTEEVVRTAPCPVLTIRPDAFQFELP
jgi:nucleotide-binding universal stress UspA family protein